jgi:DNA-binding HxlR family transcriptional regulator
MDEIKDSECSSISSALKIVGDKWTGLLVRELTTGPKRFTALQEGLVGISPRTLSQRLDMLEQCDIVSRKVYAESPPRVEYALTKKGEDLIPILQSMVGWGVKYPG